MKKIIICLVFILILIAISAYYFYKQKSDSVVVNINFEEEKNKSPDILDKISFIKNDENSKIFDELIFFINQKKKDNIFQFKNMKYEFKNFLFDFEFFFANFDEFFKYKIPANIKASKKKLYKDHYAALTYILFWSTIIDRKNCLKTNVKDSAREYEIINPIRKTIIDLRKKDLSNEQFMKNSAYSKLYEQYIELK